MILPNYTYAKIRRPKERAFFRKGVIDRWNAYTTQKKRSPIIRKDCLECFSDGEVVGKKKDVFGKTFSRRWWLGNQEVESAFHPPPLGLDEDDKIEQIQDRLLESQDLVSSPTEGSSKESIGPSEDILSDDSSECLEGIAEMLGSRSSTSSSEDSPPIEPNLNSQVSPLLSTSVILFSNAGKGGGVQRHNSDNQVGGSTQKKSSSKISKKKKRELRKLEFDMSFGRAISSGRKSSCK